MPDFDTNVVTIDRVKIREAAIREVLALEWWVQPDTGAMIPVQEIARLIAKDDATAVTHNVEGAAE